MIDFSKDSSINAICELATVKSFFHNVAMYDKKPDPVVEVIFWPFSRTIQPGNKQYWLEYSGIVETGIDAGLVQIKGPDENGVVTGVGAGKATITASAGGKKATSAVTVKGSGGNTEITSVNITNCPTSLLANQKYTLRATTTPANGKITWYTSNNNVATVSNGVVTPKGTGAVRISAVSGGKEAICQIIITDGISLNGCPTG